MKVLIGTLAALPCALLLAPCTAEVAGVVADHRHHPQHHHTRKKSAPSHASEKKRPEDDMPHLPDVSSLLGQASETLKGIKYQANTLESRLSQIQKESKGKMSRQKSVFDRRLESQEEDTRAVIRQSAEISTEIAKLKDENTAARKRAKELQTGNRLMRIELQTLQTKLGVSRDFVGNSLAVTDDSKAKELLILKTKDKDDSKDKNSDEDSHTEEDDDDDREDGENASGDDDDSDDGDDDAGPSFLALAAKTQRAAEVLGDEAQIADLDAGDQPEFKNPKDFLTALQKGVENLANEDKDGDAKLKTIFLSSFRAGLKRHTSIVAEQKALNSTRSSLTDRKVQLNAAETHLKRTKSHLEERLRGLGLFLQKLAHVALAPSGEAPRMIKALPSSISIPSEEAATKESEA